MKNRQVKDRDSDSDDAAVDVENREMTEVELQRKELENTPVIPQSEVSPAAYVFQYAEQDDIQIYEEQ